jgi:predicted phage-related endonuclease
MSVKIVERVVEVVASVEVATAILPAEAEALVIRLNNARRAAKEVEREEAEVKSALMALLGEAQVGVINGVERIKVTEVTREGIDKATLVAAFPEAYEAARTTTTYKKVTTL